MARFAAAPLGVLATRSTLAALLETCLGRRSAAQVLAGRLRRETGETIRAVLLGGELQGHEDATLGADAVATLARYRADIAFVGAGAIASDGALTDFTRDGAELRGRMLAAAKIAAIVADRSKFGQVTPVRVPGFEHATHLISDRAPDKALAAKLKSRRIKLIVAR